METNTNAKTSEGVLVLLVSGACCVPQMAIPDQQAEKIIQQALAETGITAQVRKLTISSALRGGIPAEVLNALGVKVDPSNLMRLPGILINNKLVSFGVPKLETIKNALISAQSTPNIEGDK